MIRLNQQRKVSMTLEEFFRDKPRGAKIALARKVGISKTWMSLLTSGRQVPSPELAHSLERHTNGQVRRADLRPDLFGRIV
jgi:DNA-binding transcriptional regulator YdaS (Cro superfamily)